MLLASSLDNRFRPDSAVIEMLKTFSASVLFFLLLGCAMALHLGPFAAFS
jgi:hypothetical protein